MKRGLRGRDPQGRTSYNQEQVLGGWEAVGKLYSMTGVEDMKMFTNVVLVWMKRRSRPHSLALPDRLEKNFHSVQWS